MATAKWKGEAGGAEEATMYGLTFKKGEAVDISKLDPAQQQKLKNNQYFECEGLDEPSNPKSGGTEVPPDQYVYVPPSQQVAQGPVPKPGEVRPADAPPIPLKPVPPAVGPKSASAGKKG